MSDSQELKPLHIMGPWMSAALADPKVCDEMKRDIRVYLAAIEKEWKQGAPPAPTGIDERAREAAEDVAIKLDYDCDNTAIQFSVKPIIVTAIRSAVEALTAQLAARDELLRETRRERDKLAHKMQFLDESKIGKTIDRVRSVARNLGYAIAVHGSQRNDLDLLAVPWTDNAAGEQALVSGVKAAVQGTELGRVGDKPHGRRAYTIQCDCGAPASYIDLSVMPTTARIDALLKQETDRD